MSVVTRSRVRDLIAELERALVVEAESYLRGRKAVRKVDGRPCTEKDSEMMARLMMNELKPPVRSPEIIRLEIALAEREGGGE